MKYLVLSIIFAILLAAPLRAEMSDPQRTALSNQMLKDINSKYGAVGEPDSDSQVTRVFNNLVQFTIRKKIKYRVRVVENRQVNAYAAPDGRVVFFTGLLKKLPSDDVSPMAWVAAHEISHIELRHSEKLFQKSLTSGILLALLVGHSNGWVQGLGAVSQGILVSGYSRDKEYEADREGLVLMQKAGYDPNGALVTLRLFKQMERGSLRIFPTHPRPADRFKSAIAWMESNGIAVADRELQPAKAAVHQSEDAKEPEDGGEPDDREPGKQDNSRPAKTRDDWPQDKPFLPPPTPQPVEKPVTLK